MGAGGYFPAWRERFAPDHELHPVAHGEPVCRGFALMDLYGLACRVDRGQLKRGQLRGSLQRLATRWGTSVKRVRTLLRDFEAADEIRTERARHGTVITLLQFDSYGPRVPAWGTPEASRGTRRGTPRKGPKPVAGQQVEVGRESPEGTPEGTLISREVGDNEETASSLRYEAGADGPTSFQQSMFLRYDVATEAPRSRAYFLGLGRELGFTDSNGAASTVDTLLATVQPAQLERWFRGLALLRDDGRLVALLGLEADEPLHPRMFGAVCNGEAIAELAEQRHYRQLEDAAPKRGPGWLNVSVRR